MSAACIVACFLLGIRVRSFHGPLDNKTAVLMITHTLFFFSLSQIKVHSEYESSCWVNSSCEALLPPTGRRKHSTFNCGCVGSSLQDTGISVRKRVIKILRDICLEQPTFNKITEMCVKMIRRVNDEEGIKV